MKQPMMFAADPLQQLPKFAPDLRRPMLDNRLPEFLAPAHRP